MQFQRVKIGLDTFWVFMLTKWEASAFVLLGKNKKAPADEQAVRFGVYGDMAIVWATDGAQLLSLEAPGVQCPNDEICVPAWSLKERAVKCRTNQALLFPVGKTDVYVAPKQDLVVGDQVHSVELAGTMVESGPLDWGPTQLHAVRAHATRTTTASSGVATWQCGGRFSATLAAIAKATGDVPTTWINAPADADAPMVVRARDDRDGALWSAAIMPLAHRPAPT